MRSCPAALGAVVAQRGRDLRCAVVLQVPDPQSGTHGCPAGLEAPAQHMTTLHVPESGQRWLPSGVGRAMGPAGGEEPAGRPVDQQQQSRNDLSWSGKIPHP